MGINKMSSEILTNNSPGMPNDYMYTCDECGQQEQVSIGCFGMWPKSRYEWVRHREKLFCTQKCADTFEVRQTPMTRRISKREYEDKYGSAPEGVKPDQTREEFMNEVTFPPLPYKRAVTRID